MQSTTTDRPARTTPRRLLHRPSATAQIALMGRPQLASAHFRCCRSSLVRPSDEAPSGELDGSPRSGQNYPRWDRVAARQHGHRLCGPRVAEGRRARPGRRINRTRARVRGLIDQYGADTVQSVMHKLIGDTETAVGERLASLPDGRCTSRSAARAPLRQLRHRSADRFDQVRVRPVASGDRVQPHADVRLRASLRHRRRAAQHPRPRRARHDVRHRPRRCGLDAARPVPLGVGQAAQSHHPPDPELAKTAMASSGISAAALRWIWSRRSPVDRASSTARQRAAGSGIRRNANT